MGMPNARTVRRRGQPAAPPRRVCETCFHRRRMLGVAGEVIVCKCSDSVHWMVQTGPGERCDWWKRRG